MQDDVLNTREFSGFLRLRSTGLEQPFYFSVGVPVPKTLEEGDRVWLCPVDPGSLRLPAQDIFGESKEQAYYLAHRFVAMLVRKDGVLLDQNRAAVDLRSMVISLAPSIAADVGWSDDEVWLGWGTTEKKEDDEPRPVTAQGAPAGLP